LWLSQDRSWQLDPQGRQLRALLTPSGTELARHRTGDVAILEPSQSDFACRAVRKTYLYPSWRDRFRGAFRNTFLASSRAFREVRNLERLADLGINPRLALAAGELQTWGFLQIGVLWTRWWPSQDLAALLPVQQPAARLDLLQQLGAFVRGFHDQGYVDRDFHLRNVLRTADGEFGKIDCPRGNFPAGPLLGVGIRRDLSDLRADIAAFGAAALSAFQRGYDAGPRA
jgi:hypothetical protein